MAVPADGAKGSGETSGTLTSAGDGQTSGIAAATSKDGIVWLTNEAEGLRIAKETGKPMMIDFMAEWCAACKQLDKETFSTPQVRSILQTDFVLVKIDCTEETDENSALQKKYKSMSLPTVAFVTPRGKNLENLTLYEFEKPEKFLERLDKVKAEK
jgi:thiol:disulfide interchange protein DsbD